MAPKEKLATKQQPLVFPSKRSTAISNAKGKESKSPATLPSTPIPATAAQVAETEAEEIVASTTSAKRKTRSATKAQTSDIDKPAGKKRKLQEVEDSPSTKGKTKEEKGKRVFKSRVSIENVEDRTVSRDQEISSDIELVDGEDTTGDEKAKKSRFRKHFGEVREKMGNIAPVHPNGQKSEHYMLRVFDLSYEYGPCIGMTRLQRWERAEALGLNPPLAVKELLSTEENKDDSVMSQCVFYGEI